jgi:uncharacterized protein (DUF697 family)
MRCIAVWPLPVSALPVDPTALIRGLPAPLITFLRRRWLAVVLLGGGGLAVDLGFQLRHWLSGGSALTLAAAAGGALWLLRPRRVQGPVETDLEGWLHRLDLLLPEFESLEGVPTERAEQLKQLRDQIGLSRLQIAVVSVSDLDTRLQQALEGTVRCPGGISLHWADPLPRWSDGWQWPQRFRECDLLLHWFQAPLSAAQLRWIEAMPLDQPAWLLVSINPELDPEPIQRELDSQLASPANRQLMFWDGSLSSLGTGLQPLLEGLRQDHANWRRNTRLRLARQLHGQWQAELEVVRRQQLDKLLVRTQWLVAAGVVVTPLPSLDLLVLAVANGLMLQEMARLWRCPWTIEQLRAAAGELARASLALGVVEWSSQSLAELLKLHGATWLVGGAVQALSAAYLTRVVGRAMADVLALSSGVSEPDLERLKREAPLIVARAAGSERLNWSRFLQDSREWLQTQVSGA